MRDDGALSRYCFPFPTGPISHPIQEHALGAASKRLKHLYGRRQLPWVARAHYPREIRSWALLAFALGAVEGGVAGVIVKNAFAGEVSSFWLSIAVALVTGAPQLANIFSFLWAWGSQGRDKIRFLLFAQVACVLCLLLIAAAPINPMGLVLMTTGVIAARVCWSGVTTIRSTVWRANYPRELLAYMTGRLVTFAALIMGGVGIVLGLAMDQNENAFRVILPILAAIGMAGALGYRRLRVRRHRKLLRDELAAREKMMNPFSSLSILGEDSRFRHYMSLMMVFGSGNLMLKAPLILILAEQLEYSQFQQMMVTGSIPLLIMPFCVPLWARMLDSRHVVHYRARQSWGFVVAFSVLALAAISGWMPLMWVGSALYGAAMAGGILGWNIGHHDFAPPAKASQYMGVHVSLTGLRGLIAPLLGVGLYQVAVIFLPDYSRWVLLLPLLLVLTGALGFVRMSRKMKAEE
jgi:MFS family permease